jgi:hypothetical protein
MIVELLVQGSYAANVNTVARYNKFLKSHTARYSVELKMAA